MPEPWERRERESARSYEAFRIYRDLGPTRTLERVSSALGRIHPGTVRRWAASLDWAERARAWEEHLYRIEDAERLEQIRAMHRNHQRIGRAAMAKAMTALDRLDEMPAAVVVRLLDLGTRLERSTLITTPEELFGIEPAEPAEADDPWDAIARELRGA